MMKIICTSNLQPGGEPYQELDIGETFQVYGLETSLTEQVVYIQAVGGHHFPSPYPLANFDIVQGNLPSGWALAKMPAGSFRLGPPEWVEDPVYYERLLDGEKAALEAYAHWSVRGVTS